MHGNMNGGDGQDASNARLLWSNTDAPVPKPTMRPSCPTTGWRRLDGETEVEWKTRLLHTEGCTNAPVPKPTMRPACPSSVWRRLDNETDDEWNARLLGNEGCTSAPTNHPTARPTSRR